MHFYKKQIKTSLKYRQHLTKLRIQFLDISLIFFQYYGNKNFYKYCFYSSHDNTNFFIDTGNFSMTNIKFSNISLIQRIFL